MAVSRFEKTGEIGTRGRKGTQLYREKIILGREFYYSSWILTGYKELVQKSDTITDDEAINIQLPTAIHLFRIREIMLRQSLTSALRSVEDVFSEELSAIRDEEIKYSTEQEKVIVKEDEMRRHESEEQLVLLAIPQAEEEEGRDEASVVFNPFFQKECEMERLMSLEFFG